ncbi:MAG: pyridoxal phosphate-dependent decarboxylase family protein [Terriglobia bacterium]
MGLPASPAEIERREAPLEMSPEEFRAAGHRLVERIADLLGSLPARPVTPGESPQALRELLGNGSLPESGAPAGRLLDETASLLIDHSLFNGHPRFMGYITSPPAPIGILGELLAAAVNPNCGAWILAPMATEIEAQAVKWIAEMIGYPGDCGGLLVSGGNMANFVGFLAARRARARWDIGAAGVAGANGMAGANGVAPGPNEKIGPTNSSGARPGRLRVYVSSETHTWIHKATDLFGLGTESIRWISVDDRLRISTALLRRQIREDFENGDVPFLIVGNAGSVSTGAIDPLPELAAIARENGLWLHADGAYGAVAAVLPDAPADLRGLAEADSVAVDPHKWLYAPLEAGCALVRDRKALRDAFSYGAPYYHFEGDGTEVFNYFEYGMQNSRGFRALKVWLALRHAGREGYARMIADDIHMAEALHRFAAGQRELQTFPRSLSITTFRYVPGDLKPGGEQEEAYLNQLNTELLNRLQRSGEAFLSNAVVRGAFVLRACIVNFRTSLDDVRAVPGIVIRLGREVDASLRPAELRG